MVLGNIDDFLESFLSELAQVLGTADSAFRGEFSRLQLTGVEAGKHWYIWAFSYHFILLDLSLC